MGQPARSPASGAPVADTSGAGEGGLSRRLFLGAGATTLGLAAAGCSAVPATQKARTRLQLTLSPPTGPYPVGTVPLHLVDRSRQDPWVPARPRELMVSVWYPALDAGRFPPAPWIPEAAGALSLEQLTRIADTRFVLDELAALDSGVNPDAEQRPLPAGLTRALDLTEIGMFGHSLGGATAAKVMAADARIGAGIDLDGSLFLTNPSLHLDPEKAGAAVGRHIGDRPFMIMSSHGAGIHNDPSWRGFWPNLRGWRLFLTMRNSLHYTYTDLEEVLTQLLAAGIIPPKLANLLVRQWIGTVNPARAVAAERAYIGAFFDLHLRGRASKLLDHPSPDQPDIQFLGR